MFEGLHVKRTPTQWIDEIPEGTVEEKRFVLEVIESKGKIYINRKESPSGDSHRPNGMAVHGFYSMTELATGQAISEAKDIYGPENVFAVRGFSKA